MSSARDGLAQSVQTRLLNHARAIGADPNAVLARYGLERFLHRLGRSAHVDRFVLKGGMLLRVWLGETSRPTRDADLLGYGSLSIADLERTVPVRGSSRNKTRTRHETPSALRPSR